MILGISRTSGVPHPKDQGIQVAGWVLQVGGDVNNLADGVTSLGQWGIWKEESFMLSISSSHHWSCEFDQLPDSTTPLGKFEELSTSIPSKTEGH